MNGESQEILHELDIRLSTLETKLLEKWNSHDKLADERHQERKTVNKVIFKKLDNLPCDKRIGFFTYAKWHLGILTTIMLLIIAALFRIST